MANRWKKHVQAARQLVRQCQEAGADAYTGAAYDQARAHF